MLWLELLPLRAPTTSSRPAEKVIRQTALVKSIASVDERLCETRWVWSILTWGDVIRWKEREIRTKPAQLGNLVKDKGMNRSRDQHDSRECTEENECMSTSRKGMKTELMTTNWQYSLLKEMSRRQGPWYSATPSVD